MSERRIYKPKNKKLTPTPCIINCLASAIYESPRGLSICDLFANFSA